MKKYILTSLDEFKQAEQYWLRKFSGELNETKLYTDFPRTGQYAEANYKTAIGKEETSKLLQVSKNNHLSMYIITLASLKIMLYKYLRQGDIITAAPIYSISSREYNKYVFFRDFLHPRMTFKDLLNQVKDTVVEGYKNEHFSFKELENRLQLQEGLSLARIVLLLENIHQKEFIHDIRGDYENDMVISLQKNDHGLEVEVIYNSRCFKQKTIQTLLKSYQYILDQVLSNTGIEISRVELITEQEKHQVLSQFNRTGTSSPDSKTIPRWFEEQVEKTPHRDAVASILDLSDIYEELNRESKTMNRHLAAKIEKCCFKVNPFIFSFDIEISPGDPLLKILKTHRHTCVIVNNNVVELIDYFDGKTNIKSIFSLLKGMRLKFYVYPINIEDLLEISCSFLPDVEEFSAHSFEEFIGLIKLLYKNYIIELTDLAETPLPGPRRENFNQDETFNKTLLLDDLFNRRQDLPHADVLFIGDTPGMPTVGLLYMASYLWRNGIKALCHFHDLNGDYLSLKKNIEGLLDKIRPKVVGVSMKWFPYMARVLEICKIVKAHTPGVKIVVGANTASYYWEQVIAHDFVDIVVRGDGEVPMLKICREAEYLPNCVYKKDGKIIANPITYVHNKDNSKDIYLSHLDKILISRYAALFGTFFIPTQKGCTLNCCYCGGCRGAQQKAFGRKGIFPRGIPEVRKDLIEAKKYASLFMFDLIESNEYYVDYFKKITEGIDLSTHFCVYGNYIAPSAEVVDLMCGIFKYVYWELDLASLSQRHRDQLVAVNLVKLQPTDKDIIVFYEASEKYDNGEVRMNLIAGLPYFNHEDIKESDNLLKHIISHYRCFSDFHWGRLHAQPGAPIVEEAENHDMYSYAATYEDFLEYSRRNFDYERPFPGIEDYNYPYVYFKNEELNSAVSKHSVDTRATIDEYKIKRRQSSIIEEKLTYRQLNEKANQLARVLREKGVRTGDIVPLITGSSLAMVVSILGVLKAGGAYLPIDPEYPPGRQEYMLKNGSAGIIIAQEDLIHNNENIKNLLNTLSPRHTILVDDGLPDIADVSNLNLDDTPAQLAYVIFTSGTSGKPKGVLVEHKGLVNYIAWRVQMYGHTQDDVTLQPLSYCFDGFNSNFYSSLLSGGTLVVVPDSSRVDFEHLKAVIKHKGVTNVSWVPQMYQALLDSGEDHHLETLRFMVLAGDKSPAALIKKSKEKAPGLLLFNEYGPTEATVTAAGHSGMEETGTVIIGSPIFNTCIHILDVSLKPVPINIPGELCIAGTGLARGYLNNPVLTAEKFKRAVNSHSSLVISSSLKTNDQCPMTDDRLYFTGDLARWHWNGNIELLGRIDQQVKIRGFRVELQEIENQLLTHEKIKEAVVLANEDENQEKYLCAYIVPQSSYSPGLDAPELREYLLGNLPVYMLPKYFVTLERILLNSNGKVDKKALPHPESGRDRQAYTAPSSEVERKLVEIWTEVLGIKKEKPGINANFFELGGHSLKATIIVAKIHKEWDVKLSMVDMFKNPTIRGFAQLIQGQEKDKYVSIKPVERKEYYPLSSAQKRMYFIQQVDRSSTTYNMPFAVDMEGTLHINKLRAAFINVIKRHESLRTSFEMIEGDPVQKIHENVEFNIDCYCIQDAPQSPNAIIKDFISPFDLSRAPLLRVRLIEQEDSSCILVLDGHHVTMDGISMGILVSDLMAFYLDEELPGIKLQYKDFTQWYKSMKLKGDIAKQEEFWLKQFEIEILELKLPHDYPRPLVQSFEGDTVGFSLGSEETGALKALALEENATLFALLLTIYYIFLSRISGQEDIVVGTAVSGRRQEDLLNILGMFVNVLALRNYPGKAKTFKALLKEVKEQTVKALANQDYQFDDLVNKLKVRHLGRNPLFDVGFQFQDLDRPSVDIPGLKLKPYGYESRVSKLDISLMGEEIGKQIMFWFEYSTKLFKKKTIDRFIHYFKEIVGYVIKDKEIKLKDIEISHYLKDPVLKPTPIDFGF